MNKFFNILAIFLIWRIALILVSILAIKFLPLADTGAFLGGGFINYAASPEFFSWANFDGEHYLSIAIFGYKGLEQAFFPVYPFLISLFSKPFSHDLLSSLINSTLTGLIISNVSFLLALIALWKLLIIDFSKKISLLTILLIVSFPTSFYFGAVYNESLFLLLSVLAFLSARKGNWLLASILGMMCSATRIFGLMLFPAFIIEAYLQKAKISRFFWILLIPLGLLGYMYYQYINTGDPLAFYHLQKLVGEQHQSGLTFLPQVYFRYIKILATVDNSNLIYQTIVLEFIIGLGFFLLPIYGYFKKIRLSYLIYAMLGFLLPTIQGSFSSVPRYVIVFFPSFLALALFLGSKSKYVKILTIIVFGLLLLLETALFLRGYWVA